MERREEETPCRDGRRMASREEEGGL